MPFEPGQIVNSYADEHQAISERFDENFDSSLIPIQFGNFGLLKKGNVTVSNPDDTDQFVRFNLIGGPGESPEITRSFTRVNGLISISIFTKKNLGSRKGRVVADTLFTLFNRVSFNGIRTEAATLVDAGFNDGRYQVNLTIPYRWERCLS